MAKRKLVEPGVGEQPPAPQWYATTHYKLWVRKEIARDDRKWTLKELVAHIKRIDPSANATSGGLSQFLGRSNQTPKPSNTTLMPAINELLGVAPPSIYDPTDTILQLKERLAASWASLEPSVQNAILSLLKSKTSNP